jgi:hypothetical protein
MAFAVKRSASDVFAPGAAAAVCVPKPVVPPVLVPDGMREPKPFDDVVLLPREGDPLDVA